MSVEVMMGVIAGVGKTSVMVGTTPAIVAVAKGSTGVRVSLGAARLEGSGEATMAALPSGLMTRVQPRTEVVISAIITTPIIFSGRY
jgi:hypothetical protein